MQYLNIAGAAALSGLGLGSLAASAVMWRRAGFNLADVAIVVGTGVLLWYAWRRKPTSHPADASHGSEHDVERRPGPGRG